MPFITRENIPGNGIDAGLHQFKLPCMTKAPASMSIFGSIVQQTFNVLDQCIACSILGPIPRLEVSSRVPPELSQLPHRVHSR
jgi:hypothetical protein